MKTSDIANKAVSAAKLKSGAVPANGIAANSIDAGKLGLVVTRKTITPLADNAQGSATAYCKSGEQLLGGGGSVGAQDVFQSQSTPTQVNHDPEEGAPAQGWVVVYNNPAGGTAATTIFAWAVCLQ